MATLINVLLILHVTAGFTALLSGGVAAMSRKGQNIHKGSGRWYFWAMTGVFVTAIVLAPLKNNFFLFQVGFFSYYLVVRGYRRLYFKKFNVGNQVPKLDWAITTIALLFGISLIVWALHQFNGGNSFWPVPLVFGFISAGFALLDLQLYLKGPAHKQHWITGHIAGMGGGYIATWTAFLVTNVHFLPPVFVWLLPTVIGTGFIAWHMRKYRIKRKPVVVAAAFFLCALRADAQTVDSVYTEAYLKRSTSFAWLTLGGDAHIHPGGSSTTADGKSFDFGTGVQPRFTISGVHFWGHADFYVSIPLPVIVGNQSAEGQKIKYQTRVETGARVYPWKLRPGRLSPYAGVSFRALSYRQLNESENYEHQAPDYDKFVFPWQAGVTYTSRKYHFTAGVHYWRQPKIGYYTSPTATGAVKLQPFTFNVGFVRYMDLDKGMANAKGTRRENILYSRLKQYRKLNTAYWGIGPSAALPLNRSSYFQEQAPALYGSLPIAILPDLTLGYHFANPDVNIGLSYRPIFSTIKGYNDKAVLGRHSVMLEGYKFVTNWLGFAPYIGPTISLEKLSLNHNGERTAQWKPAVGLIAGWDIRVTRTGTSLLRTNLRWVPNLHLDVKGKKVAYDALEFNFIQYVVFIGRKKFYREQFK